MNKKLAKAVQELPVPVAKKTRRYGFEFYRDNFRRMTVLALGLVGLDIVLVVAMFLVYASFPSRDLYATTRNGLLVKLKQFDNVDQVKASRAAKAAVKVESANP
ncbi:MULTISPECIES: hypothetical protein [Undibacterium]|jgi:hypothetical protein|uniref:Uncharacterized protein n=1 Tax=Undibacterium umbellatum TaxID=2762300 RepID=A0ABR6ZGA4_9BURK|nr:MULTISPECIES: hypothetical protein [Undibacterium]MBC3910747.1 hypothetical protein [Undibacterium umbellatum]MDP1977860.1 hypothetical protein [Undibacterium sp.]